jgi:autotransporter-associated beta strand protein
VTITNLADNSVMTAKTIPLGTTAALSSAFRFVTLDSPVTLTPGNYRIWVTGLGGTGNDSFTQGRDDFDLGDTGAITIGRGAYNWEAGSMPIFDWGPTNLPVCASFMFYDPSSIISANVLTSTTPVLLGGPAGTTPTLAIELADLKIASLADVAGAVVKGVVTGDSLGGSPVTLTLTAPSGTATYSGSITGDLNLVKDGGATQILGLLNYAGDTTVNEGTLQVSSIDTPLSAVYVADNAILSASSITADSLTIGGPKHLSAAVNTTPVPEPGTLLLLALAGLVFVGAYLRRK